MNYHLWREVLIKLSACSEATTLLVFWLLLLLQMWERLLVVPTC
jgi:hypothetical protein